MNVFFFKVTADEYVIRDMHKIVRSPDMIFKTTVLKYDVKYHCKYG